LDEQDRTKTFTQKEKEVALQDFVEASLTGSV
jgi:hypothetical protein